MTEFITNGDYSAVAQAFALPTENAIVYGRFGGTEAASFRNLANEAQPLVEAGAIAMQSGYLSADSNGNNLSTGLLESASMTIMAVARAPLATGSSRMVSCNSGAGSRGLAFYLTATTVVMAATFDDATTTLVANCAATIPNNDDWALYVGEIEAGVGLRVKDETRGPSAAFAKTTPRTAALGTIYPMLVGSRPGTPATGSEIDMNGVLIIPAILSATDRLAWVARMRAWATAKGITV